MDQAETARFRQVIENRLKELQDDISDKLGEAAEVNSDLDRGNDAGEQSVVQDITTGDFADARRDTREYQDGVAALARLEAGEYGICIDCGTDIPIERLEAQPFAARCIACQERIERGTGFHSTTM